jgi:hypothetical protein
MDRLGLPKFVYKREQKWRLVDLLQLHDARDSGIPRHYAVARSLASAEALNGQLYLAILIGRLVALEVASRQNS